MKTKIECNNKARIQPLCKRHNINLGCSAGSRRDPRNNRERNQAIYTHKNHFCLSWKSQGLSFYKAIEELNLNFKINDNCISEKHVKSFNENGYNLKKYKLN